MKFRFKIKVGIKELEQSIICPNNEILIEVGGNKLIFFKELNECFSIDENNKNLTKVDYTNVKKQLADIKKLIGDSKSAVVSEGNKYLNYSSRKLEFNFEQNGLTINSLIKTATIKGIDTTAYPAFQQYEKSTQIIDTPLLENEMVAYNRTEIITAQGIQTQELELVSVEESDCAEEINEILSYQLAENK